MPYVEGRVVHDADSHIFEPPGYAEAHADPKMRQRLSEALETGETPAFMDAALAKQKDPAFRAKDAEEIMLRKNHVALGAMLRDDRPAALDHLGFASQLVFTTTYLAPLRKFDLGEDIELAYALATAHNRGIVDFCSVDRRLLPVGYVPFAAIDRAASAAAAAIDRGGVHGGALKAGRVCRSPAPGHAVPARAGRLDHRAVRSRDDHVLVGLPT